MRLLSQLGGLQRAQGPAKEPKAALGDINMPLLLRPLLGASKPDQVGCASSFPPCQKGFRISKTSQLN
jgi:hypothetical protein